MKVEGIKLRLPALLPAWSEGLQRIKRRAWARLPLLVLGAWLLAGLIMVLAGRVYFYHPLAPGEAAPQAMAPARPNAEARSARIKLEALKPRGVYILIDAAANTLYLKRNEQILHQAACSTGSGLLLRDPAGNRQWVFDTPRGLFHVREKVEDPVWKKPDWAFIEEGQPIPQRFSERLDEDSLGEYALHLATGT